MQEISVPVLVVGGGGAGLSAHYFLSNIGVDNLLIERHHQSSPLPKARGINRRVLEIFRQCGLEQAFRDGAMPGWYSSRIRWMTSLAGDDPVDGRTIYEMDSFGGGEQNDIYQAGSPFANMMMFPQIRLEPFLVDQCARIASGKALFGHELTGLEQTGDHVMAEVEKRETGETIKITAQYVVAADGGRFIGPKIGANFEGTTLLTRMNTTYFKADLSSYLDDDRLSTIIFVNPKGETANWSSGALGKLGGEYNDRRCKEWLLHSSIKETDPEKFTDNQLAGRIRGLLNIPDLEVEVLGCAPWNAQGLLADQYRFGRIFLVGDSAHRHPPATGLGLVSGIQDVHNLAWKLRLILDEDGIAGDGILDSYEAERRPVARRNIDWSLFAFSNTQLTGPAVGIVPGSPEESVRNMLQLDEESEVGRARRRRLEDVLEMNRTEFRANNLEIGYAYETGALVRDSQPAPEPDPTGLMYVPTTRPGHRLPHAFILDDGALISTLDLVDPARFTLICHEEFEQSWTEAVNTLPESISKLIHVAAIGDRGRLRDHNHNWRRLREIEENGALLVRPDQHVGWRSISMPADPTKELAEALNTILSPA
jgi:2,4-dichlorophenol 6-monooxygenase